MFLWTENLLLKIHFIPQGSQITTHSIPFESVPLFSTLNPILLNIQSQEEFKETATNLNCGLTHSIICPCVLLD